ncbi:MAG: hypothetical protein WDN26_02205 [Chitinophagaceae bacterium]
MTGSIIAQDRAAVELATNTLRNAAGNFYIMISRQALLLVNNRSVVQGRAVPMISRKYFEFIQVAERQNNKRDI